MASLAKLYVLLMKIERAYNDGSNAGAVKGRNDDRGGE